MKIEAWTLLCYFGKEGEEIGLATGDSTVSLSSLDTYFVYLTNAQLQEALDKLPSRDAISPTFEAAMASGNRFWIQCVEIDV